MIKKEICQVKFFVKILANIIIMETLYIKSWLYLNILDLTT